MQKNLLVVVSISYLIAIGLTIVPFPENYQWYKPLWLPMFCLFWSIAYPYQIHLGINWFFALLLDVATGVTLGHTAIGILVISFFANKLAHRLKIFPFIHQFLFVIFLLTLYQLITFWIFGLMSQLPKNWHYWYPIITSGLCWLALFSLFKHQLIGLHKE